jgi:hypothetical protein
MSVNKMLTILYCAAASFGHRRKSERRQRLLQTG